MRGMCLQVEYSPLCDTNPELYRAYLQAVERLSAFCNGSSAVDAISGGGSGNGCEGCGCGDNLGKHVVGLGDRVPVEERRDSLAMGVGAPDGHIVDCVGVSTNVGNESCAAKVVGVAGVGAVCGSGCVDGVVNDECSGRGHGASGTWQTRLVSNVLGGQYRRGVRRRYGGVTGGQWQKLGDSRRSPSASVVSVTQSGFWNSCSSEKRQQLIDSKADMHIAENRRRAAAAMAQVEYSQSEVAMADRALAILKRSRGLVAQGAGEGKVVDWARAVYTTSADSVSSKDSKSQALGGSASSSLVAVGESLSSAGLPRRDYAAVVKSVVSAPSVAECVDNVSVGAKGREEFRSECAGKWREGVVGSCGPLTPVTMGKDVTVKFGLNQGSHSVLENLRKVAVRKDETEKSSVPRYSTAAYLRRPDETPQEHSQRVRRMREIAGRPYSRTE